MVRAVVVLVAIIAAVVPVPAAAVERFYSAGIYPLWQRWATTTSNLVPIALVDALIVIAVVAWLALAARDVITRPRGFGRAALRVLVRTAVWASVVYLAFLASWGLNYRRVGLADKLAYSSAQVSEDGLRALTTTAVARLNALHAAAHRVEWPDGSTVDPIVASGFAAAERDLGASRPAVPGRPKRSLLDPSFRRAVVDGMTDPFFLETLVVSDLLPFERPFVTAHEWAHLAGYNDEGEANFVGWLACMRGDEARQYSGWIFLYSEGASQLSRADRQEAARRLADGPRADLRAISDRVARNRSARVAETGWLVYNQYLKANRVESGTASYAEVIQLILGTRFNPGLPPPAP